MRPGYQPGFVGLRTLDADDVAGICSLYGAEAGDRPSQCEPRHGFSRQCAMEETGCAVRGRVPRSTWPLSLFAVGLGLIAARRRAARRRQSAGA